MAPGQIIQYHVATNLAHWLTDAAAASFRPGKWSPQEVLYRLSAYISLGSGNRVETSDKTFNFIIEIRLWSHPIRTLVDTAAGSSKFTLAHMWVKGLIRFESHIVQTCIYILIRWQIAQAGYLRDAGNIRKQGGSGGESFEPLYLVVG